jgi:superoxide dismutase, Cu-Zn family
MTKLMIAGAVLTWAAVMPGVAVAQQKASADIRDAAGKKVGEALLEQRDGEMEITATFSGLSPGVHAFHIHEVGKCDPPFDSAGGHFNPTGKQHGKDNPTGPHAGDLPNLDVPQSGGTKVEITINNVSLASLLDANGAALVVHEGADDYTSDPDGKAGKRVACGVIRR